jgi:hypothetical protein
MLTRDLSRCFGTCNDCTWKNKQMSRLMALFALLVFCGCHKSDDVTTHHNSPGERRAVDSPPVASAFRLDESNQVIFLDSRIAPPQRRRFDIGLGSITLETLQVKDNQLRFRYVPEIEGGFTIYECTVPVSPSLIEIKIAPDGTPGATSFVLTDCKVIRHGNLHVK